MCRNYYFYFVDGKLRLGVVGWLVNDETANGKAWVRLQVCLNLKFMYFSLRFTSKTSTLGKQAHTRPGEDQKAEESRGDFMSKGNLRRKKDLRQKIQKRGLWP